MNPLLWLLLLTEVDQTLESDNLPATKETPDAELLLFLAEWSDENDQWVDPDLFAEAPVTNPPAKNQKAEEDEQNPDIN